MAALSNRALHEQLSVIMEALTKAAVAEICEVVDEGYAVLQLEINRSRHENEALKKKLHLIESIVIRGSGSAKTAEPEVVAPAEDAPQQRQWQRDGGGEAVPHAEFPDVVLIKDEDSDSKDSFGEENEETTIVTSTQIGRSVKRRHSGNNEAETPSSTEHVALNTSRRTSVAVYAVDSPRSEPGCSSADEAETGKSVCSYSSQMDVQVVQENSLVPLSSSNPACFSSSVMEPQSDRGDADFNLTWTKTPKSHVSFAQFHQSENADAFGLKLVSVSGSAPADSQLPENSNSVFDYADVDMMSFGLYPSGSKRFVCSVCHKTYATTQNLDVHMRIHTGERPFSCDQCGKKFTQSAHLKSHINVHTGERPHVCAVCHRTFAVRHSLKIHMSKCHPEVSLSQNTHV
ncbi:zinc finger 425-like [Solea senegalensis]|uniref:Zinc finger 425-like n=1 Tax=Solea senegalensis TaxID=28829 RepID=A0AAV6TB55_SOLSE|nr:gastrula zinc finger protein XlCGF48.2 [Solea senegalensis]XP_043882733.1 gastrula zinc finger protein XlCGF48.2 [Solea senegalensis]KAG7526609.1 zinc finger 425-like [Solea senegalensis]